jgi:F-type H+-transporting ATPase subunit b
MIVTFVIFLTMLYFLNQKLYKPLLKFMDDRDATLRREMNEAQNLSGNSSDLERQAQQVIDEAKAKAAAARQSALDALHEEQAQAQAARQKDLAEKYEAFKTALAAEKEELKSKLLGDLPMFKESLRAKIAQL